MDTWPSILGYLHQKQRDTNTLDLGAEELSMSLDSVYQLCDFG